MKIRNDGDTDRHVYGLHLHTGATVEVPDGLKASKLAFLRANFTEVTEQPIAPQRESAPPPPPPAPEPEPEPTTEPTTEVTAEPEPEPEPTTTPTPSTTRRIYRSRPRT